MAEQTCGTTVNLEKVICALRTELSWPIKELWGREGFRVESNPRNKEHTIWWPRVPLFQENSYLAYIHELIHALFAEQVHPLFSSIQFSHTKADDVSRTLPSFRAAVDWFVEHAVYSRCRDRKSAELRAQHALVRARIQAGALHEQTMAGKALVLAEAHVFLGHSVPMLQPWKDLVQCFLRTPAQTPSIFLLNGLTNRLLQVQFGERAHLVVHQGQHAWKVER